MHQKPAGKIRSHLTFLAYHEVAQSHIYTHSIRPADLATIPHTHTNNKTERSKSEYAAWTEAKNTTMARKAVNELCENHEE